LSALGYSLLGPTQVGSMLVLQALCATVYAPTIPLVWAIFADVADYSEWQTGRRFTGMVFATLGFALKSGLAVGSASFLWIMSGAFGYDTQAPGTADAVAGYRFTSGIGVSLLFAACTALLFSYTLNKSRTLEISEALAQRRKELQPA
jgi:glycoside/pentoside/hexuronide:cation symporter, GPH family